MAAPWNKAEKVRVLMALPWTVRTRRSEHGGLTAEIAELPSVKAAGDDERSLARALWQSLEAVIVSSLDSGATIPTPSGIRLPWEHGAAPPSARVRAITMNSDIIASGSSKDISLG
jgi:hypothetical protein